MNDRVTLFHERYSTALLADAAYRARVTSQVPAPGLLPLKPGMKLAGPTVTVEANNDLVSILGALHRAAGGDVLVIANHSYEVGLIGDLVAAEALRKRLAGLIVDGLVRDSDALVELGVPVFCRGRWPVGPLKLPGKYKGIGEIGAELDLGGATVRPGDWAFGDGDGLVFVAADDLQGVFGWAARSWEREEAMAREIRAGSPLGDILGIDAFLEKRSRDSRADFNEHLSSLGRAI